MVVSPFFLNPIYDYTISFFNDNNKKFLYDYNHEDYVRNNYPLLSKYEWSNTYFKELYSLPEPSYKDYVGWKYDEYIGDTINISQKGIRKTVNDKLINNDQYLFFGGSAIWGFGVSDQFTIPSIFSKMSSMKATNYAEPGYIARQSLSALTNLYSTAELKKTNNYIIFYDGYNDVINHCSLGLDPLSTVHEIYNREVIKSYKETSPYSIKWILIPIQNFIYKLKNEYYLFMNKKKPADAKENCFDNQFKAKLVAYSIINNWYLADTIAKANGDKFIAVLQPSIYSSHESKVHETTLEMFNDDINREFQAVYPILKSLISEYKDRGLTILDYSNIFDKNDVFISPGHVTPEGNDILVNKLYNYIIKNYY